MSERKSPSPAAACYAAGRCIRKCREAMRREFRIRTANSELETGPLRDWFREQCDRKPSVALLADLLRDEGRRELAAELLPDLGRYLDNLGFELRERQGRTDSPPSGSRPVLVVDNTAGKGKEVPAPARGKASRERPGRDQSGSPRARAAQGQEGCRKAARGKRRRLRRREGVDEMKTARGLVEAIESTPIRVDLDNSRAARTPKRRHRRRRSRDSRLARRNALRGREQSREPEVDEYGFPVLNDLEVEPTVTPGRWSASFFNPRNVLTRETRIGVRPTLVARTGRADDARQCAAAPEMVEALLALERDLGEFLDFESWMQREIESTARGRSDREPAWSRRFWNLVEELGHGARYRIEHLEEARRRTRAAVAAARHGLARAKGWLYPIYGVGSREELEREIENDPESIRQRDAAERRRRNHKSARRAA